MYRLNKPIFKFYSNTLIKNVQDYLSDIWDELSNMKTYFERKNDTSYEELKKEINILKKRVKDLETP